MCESIKHKGTIIKSTDLSEILHKTLIHNILDPNTLKDIFEVRFHCKLYEMTRNETLLGFQKMLLPVFNYAYSNGLINKNPGDRHFLSHRNLGEVLQKGDAEQFTQAMRMHLENHYCRLFSMDAT